MKTPFEARRPIYDVFPFGREWKNTGEIISHIQERCTEHLKDTEKTPFHGDLSNLLDLAISAEKSYQDGNIEQFSFLMLHIGYRLAMLESIPAKQVEDKHFMAHFLRVANRPNDKKNVLSDFLKQLPTHDKKRTAYYLAKKYENEINKALQDEQLEPYNEGSENLRKALTKIMKEQGMTVKQDV